MNILYASDDHYADLLGISIISLFENNRDCEDIKITIINDEISEKNIRNIECIFKKYRRKFPTFKKIKRIQEVLNMKVYEDRFSGTQFARLFLDDIMGQNEDRVLYLDCDVIINDSLSKLWNMDLNGNIGAVLADAFSPWYRGNIGLQPNDIMFNSGVMLIDMQQWKRQNIGQQLCSFICTRHGMVQQGDQGALNAVLSGKVQVFSPRYNLVTNYAAFTYEDMLIYRKPVTIYSKKEIEEAKVNPCIIHYTSSFMIARPCGKGEEHLYAYLWNHYQMMSPWKEEIKKEKRMKKWEKIYVKLIEHIPYRMNLHCSGALQAYVRPFYGRWKYGKVYEEDCAVIMGENFVADSPKIKIESQTSTTCGVTQKKEIPSVVHNNREEKRVSDSLGGGIRRLKNWIVDVSLEGRKNWEIDIKCANMSYRRVAGA